MTADQEAFFIPELRNTILETAGDVKISGIIYKPLGTADLRNAFSCAMSGEPKLLRYFVNGAGFHEGLSDQKTILEDRYSLKLVLRDLRKETQATAIVLFSIHPITNEVNIVEKSADPPGYLSELNGPLRRMLCYSPVKDVAIKNELILERRISGTPKQQKHRYLHKAVRYESCIAFPVKLPSELAYCLFAFHKRPGLFKHNDEYKLKVSAGEIGRILEIRRLIEIRREDERYLITGKSYGKLAHDLRTNLPTDISITRLLRMVDEVAQPTSEKLDALRSELKSSLAAWKRVIDVVNTFHRMFMHRNRLDHEEVENELDINPVITEVVSYLQAQARYSYHSEFQVLGTESKQRPLVRIRRAALEQVLVNLLMNAVQQIERFAFARVKGNVRIETRTLSEDNRDWVQILLHDSGPGIHRRDFDRVFDIGFTTTENGLGMGLDISKDIISEAQGKIRIKKSLLFVGTTFEILLPLGVSKEDDSNVH
jgi:signal transduction histidine kinase